MGRRRVATALALVLSGATLVACGDEEPLSSEVEPTVTEAESGTTSVAAPDANEQIAAVMGDPEIAAEVLGRSVPDPVLPDGDLAANSLVVTTMVEGDAGTSPIEALD